MKGFLMKKGCSMFLLASLIWLFAAGSSRGDGGDDLVPYSFGRDFGRKVMLVQALGTVEQEEEETAFADEAVFTERILPDPLEPINRAFFEFNDRLYFWVLKPVARGYSFVVPEKMRVGVGNVFKNLTFPVRFVNCLFQGKLEGASEELGSFLLNSIAGMGGIFDISGAAGVRRHDEDLDQSLATFGFGPGFFINWPFLGPSTLRGTFGVVGDGFLDPVMYLDSSGARWTVRSVSLVNRTSLSIGDYESLKKAALDPYVALRDAYWQNRLRKIKE
jgi:phospholipid-binding lipoprotein MlaA